MNEQLQLEFNRMTGIRDEWGKAKKEEGGGRECLRRINKIAVTWSLAYICTHSQCGKGSNMARAVVEGHPSNMKRGHRKTGGLGFINMFSRYFWINGTHRAQEKVKQEAIIKILENDL